MHILHNVLRTFHLILMKRINSHNLFTFVDHFLFSHNLYN